MTEENPYLKMDDKTLNTHLAQVKEVMDEKKISTLQFFGESLSEDTKTKIGEHASLTSDKESLTTQVKTLEAAASKGTISDDVQKLANLSIDSAASEIKGIDENFPIKAIVDSVSDPFQKVEVLKGLKSAALYSQKAVEAIKSQIPNKSTTQGFAEGTAPEATGDEATKLFDKIVADSGVKID